MARQPKRLDELFHDGLGEMYFAGKTKRAALPNLAAAARNADLKAAFERHEREIELQLSRLEKIFGTIGRKPQANTCPAIVAIFDESQAIIEDYEGSAALDAGLIAAAQAALHYQIARYGALRAWAQALGMTESVVLLDEILDADEDADDALFDLAETLVNEMAQQNQAA
jgi:ferritin-like metal-binding protein YciE